MWVIASLKGEGRVGVVICNIFSEQIDNLEGSDEEAY